MKRQLYILGTVVFLLMAMVGCKKGDKAADNAMPMMTEDYPEIKGDSMLYGLSCDGTSDSVVVIWPFKGDPITLNIIDARESGKVIGKPEIGDWIGVMVDPQDKTSATMLIDLDKLKGTWTYPVMPTMKNMQQLSRRAQRRMMAMMNDSMKAQFMVPREYGFTLKRSHNAQPVGRVMRDNTLEDDSPVQYPEVKNYRKWYMLNGRLVLISAKMPMAQGKKPTYQLDTLDFVSMRPDTLVLAEHGEKIGFHHKK